MIITIEPPHIDATNERDQIAQIKSYLCALSEQLNYVLEAIDGKNYGTEQKTKVNKKA